MARIFFFMSLLSATFYTQTVFSQTWYVQTTIYPKTYDRKYETVTFNLPNVVPSGENACLKGTFTATDKVDGNNYSGSLRMNGRDCYAGWSRQEGGSSGYGYQLSYISKSCDAGQRPQDYNNLECTNFEDLQCPEGQSPDPVTGECVISDGEPDPTDPDNGGGDGDGNGDGNGNGGGENNECNDSESCLAEAQGICSANGRSVMEYQYQGAGYYQYQCGYEDQDCGQGFSWDRTNQVCLQDLDEDGTPDQFDPEPEDPNETGDRDGDGVPDQQDSHPDDPEQWNGNPTSNHNGQNVNPIGASDQFDDSAIVEALNQNTQTSNTTNTKLDELTGQGAITNDLLNGIGESLNGLNDTLGQGEPEGKGVGDLNSAMDGALDEFEGMAIDEFNKDLDSGLFVQKDQLPTIETAFGGLELEKCEDISNFLFTIELCSLAPRINPILYWAFACFTIIACFQTVIATLKKDTK